MKDRAVISRPGPLGSTLKPSPPNPNASLCRRLTIKEICFAPGFRDGEVEESHRSQPVVQGAQEWDQEAEEAQAHFNQREHVTIQRHKEEVDLPFPSSEVIVVKFIGFGNLCRW